MTGILITTGVSILLSLGSRQSLKICLHSCTYISVFISMPISVRERVCVCVCVCVLRKGSQNELRMNQQNQYEFVSSQQPSLTFLIIIIIIIFKIYLFIFGCVRCPLLRVGSLQLRRAGATPCCCAQASHCGGLSHRGAWALGARASAVVACGLQQLQHMGPAAVARRLQSAGSVVVARGLQSTGSAIVVHRPSCSTAHGILLDQGSNPCPLYQQVDS